MHTKLIVKIPFDTDIYEPDEMIDEIDRGNLDLVLFVKDNFENVELAVERGD